MCASVFSGRGSEADLGVSHTPHTCLHGLNANPLCCPVSCCMQQKHPSAHVFCAPCKRMWVLPTRQPQSNLFTTTHEVAFAQGFTAHTDWSAAAAIAAAATASASAFTDAAAASASAAAAVRPALSQSDPAFLTALESGLKDHADVKAPTHLMLAKLATSPGEETGPPAGAAAAWHVFTPHTRLSAYPMPPCTLCVDNTPAQEIL